MVATILIVFRESLEAALLVGVVAAATRGLDGRWRWLGAGVVTGFFGAVVLALLAGHISGWLDGLGHDVVNIGVLSLALVMLLWHCVWVAAHTKEMGVSLAVLREGAETVLFVGGSLTGVEAQPGTVLLAGAAGVVLGALVGVIIYAGLTRVPTRHVFSVTNVLIAFLAASLGSQLVRALTQAGLLESWTTPVWDSSHLLAQDSAFGTFLHALIGYDARPSAAQLCAYLAVLTFIYVGARLMSPQPRDGPRAVQR